MIQEHKLPIWVNGNAYFNGAEKWKKEASCLVDQEHEIYVNLVEKDGEYGNDTNVYDFLDDFKDGIINSDILGVAFEPEERFENPDGSDIVLTAVISVIIAEFGQFRDHLQWQKLFKKESGTKIKRPIFINS